jgi:hypothetical protein
MGQAVALARRWTKSMAELFPAMAMMYSLPYRVSPTLPNIPTVLPDDPEIGPHKFAICDPTPPITTFTTAPSPYYISVQDNVLPFSAETNFITPLQAIWNSPMWGLILALGFVEEGVCRIGMSRRAIVQGPHSRRGPAQLFTHQVE